MLLFVERNKLPGLKRLLEAGGATVVTRITTAVLKEITHAFIAISHFPKEVQCTCTCNYKVATSIERGSNACTVHVHVLVYV